MRRSGRVLSCFDTELAEGLHHRLGARVGDPKRGASERYRVLGERLSTGQKASSSWSRIRTRRAWRCPAQILGVDAAQLIAPLTHKLGGSSGDEHDNVVGDLG